MEKAVNELLKVFEQDKGQIEEFLKDPKGHLEKLNIDFDAEKVHEIVDAVKSKIDLGDIMEKGEELLGGLSKMFKK